MNVQKLAEAFAEDEGIAVPLHWEICQQCRGEGTSTAYLGAYTQSDREEMGDDWYEFIEDWQRGVYDQSCDGCDGTGKVKVVDEDAIARTPELQKAWHAYANEMYALEAMERQERMMGA